MHKNNKIHFLILILLLNTHGLYSQFQRGYYEHSQKIPGANNELYLSLRGAGFFNNNEFFQTSTEGYTLTGNYFQPVLNYYFSDVFAISGGIHLLKFHGQDHFSQILPYFSINYQPVEKLDLYLGSFNKGALLSLPEPLYKFENQFTSLTGNGVMIKYSGEYWNSISWLDWLRFIEPGDPFREKFIFGHSGSLNIVNKENYQLKFPYYILAEHKGGQINISDEPVETRADLGGGLEWTGQANLGIFNKILLKSDLYFEQGSLTNKNGRAFYGYGELSGNIFSAGLGYFFEKNWESILGEPLFFSLQHPDQDRDMIQQFILIKAGLGKKLSANSSFMLRFEAYYDTGIKKFQYSYGLHIIVDEWIKIF